MDSTSSPYIVRIIKVITAVFLAVAILGEAAGQSFDSELRTVELLQHKLSLSFVLASSNNPLIARFSRISRLGSLGQHSCRRTGMSAAVRPALTAA